MKTYNLKDQEQYNELYHVVIEDIDACNPVDGNGYPLDESDDPITVDWLWENYGQFLDGTQSGLGYQLFGEVIKHYEEYADTTPLTSARAMEIRNMAKEDFLDAYECGQVKEDDCDHKLLEEMGLKTKQEQDLYTEVYMELAN